jgi:hypothetical protein
MARKRASAKREDKPKVGLESQDDQAYITGQHSQEEQEKQIRTPMPRRRGASAREGSEREEGDGSGQKED